MSRTLLGRIFYLYKLVVCTALMLVFSFMDAQYFFGIGPNIVPHASAAEVQITNDASTSAAAQTIAGQALVFIDDQVGYRFYRSNQGSNGRCAYRKTTDGGTSWTTSDVQVDAQTDCVGISVWFDQWTPGDLGTIIHIATIDSGTDNTWYNHLDTSTDTLLLGSSPVDTSSPSGQGGTFSAGANKVGITKGTDGTIYSSITDGSDSFVVECSSTCQTGANWTETGTSPLDTSPDPTILLPLPGGEILLINRDISNSREDIRAKIWNNSAWPGSWTLIDSNAPDNTAYDVGMSAMYDEATDAVYLAYIAENSSFAGADHDLRVSKYSSGSWSIPSDIITDDTRGLTSVSLGIDENTADVFVAYSARTTINDSSTANVYWASSTAAMSAWGAEQGPVNSSSDDIFGVLLNGNSDQRIYVSWFQAAVDDIFGDTIFDTSPATIVSATGTQISTVRASSTEVYIGGQFVISEFSTSRSVSSLTLSETGSIDASTAITNIQVVYDIDTSAPYDCVGESYDIADTQYGLIDDNGFSGPNGVSTFSGTVTISPTETMCAYVVLDVEQSVNDGVTLAVEIENPAVDVVVSGGVAATPPIVQALPGTTTIESFPLVFSGYHWRNDDDIEADATSATAGSENTPIDSLGQSTPVRLRSAVFNDGSTSSVSMSLGLEFAPAAPTCEDVSMWVGVDDTDDEFSIFNSAELTNGSDTTDINVADGGVTDPAGTFFSPNGGVVDVSGATSFFVLPPDNYIETEFSIVASTSATQGQTYCFRLVDSGRALDTYSAFPAVTIASDVDVSSFGTHVATADIPNTDLYVGGTFVISENNATRNVTELSIIEYGSILGNSGVENVKIQYDLDTSAPFNCVSESYDIADTQFGSTDNDGFSVDNGTSTFTGTASIAPLQAMCAYVVLDVTPTAQSGDTIAIAIPNPSADILVSGGGSVSPSTETAITGSTTVSGAVVDQYAYHWRNDDGSESAATSATGGTENSILTEVDKNQPVRLRLGLTNTGGTSSIANRFTLQFGIKISTCEAIASWTDIDDAANDSFDMVDSLNLTHSDNTTDIAEGIGGLSDGAGSFLSSNSGVRETEAITATTSLAASEYVDLEFSLASTGGTPYETDFCFRLLEGELPLVAYGEYAELTTREKRDFKVQRGTTIVSGNSATVTAGPTTYDAPAATSSAFVRITNSHYTGAGDIAGGGNQAADDTTVYITAVSDITTSFTLQRPTGAARETHVEWEVIEFIGNDGTDNEMIIREYSEIQLVGGTSVATTSAVTGVLDSSDIVVFITGVRSSDTGRNIYDSIQATAEWSSSTQEVVFTRGANGATIDISYAVVEYTGQNWRVQRVEHQHLAAGGFETASITAVTSINQTFIHTQKRVPVSSIISSFGHRAELTSMGAVTFYIEATAVSATEHYSVAWVIENTQTGIGAMQVFRSSGFTQGGPEPSAVSVGGWGAVNEENNASIFANTSMDRIGTNYPRPVGAFSITGTTTYEIWRSDTGGQLHYKTEVVEWPAADVALRQNYYRFYVDDASLTPGDPWPAGGADLGENTSITSLDEPLAEGDRLRIRLTARISNGTLPANLQQLKLQYGLRATTCSAVDTWTDVGAAGGGEIWRGFDNGALTDGTAISTDPAGGGELLISVSDRGGTYEEENNTAVNPYSVASGEDVEYDFVVEQNGAIQRNTYCFRAVRSDGTPLAEYFNYPQIRTNGYSPATEEWRWYDDEASETPSSALSAESIAPVEIVKGNTVKLRITVDEINNLSQNNTRFALQYDENPSFASAQTVAASATCSGADVWCYANGGGLDNATITESIISSSDLCTFGSGPGCGTYNESPGQLNGFTHGAFTAIEYDFTLQYQNVANFFGQVWHFRLYDISNEQAVPVNTGFRPPTLVGESGTITFTISGLPSGTSTEGVTTDVTTTPSSVPFGQLVVDSEYEAAHRLTVDTNAISGYRIIKYATQELQTDTGAIIPGINASNTIPDAWGTACTGTSSCFGYHAGDDILDGVGARFAVDDTYAAFSDSPETVMYNSGATTDVEDMVYKIKVNKMQPPGDYFTSIVYIAVPTF